MQTAFGLASEVHLLCYLFICQTQAQAAKSLDMPKISMLTPQGDVRHPGALQLDPDEPVRRGVQADGGAQVLARVLRCGEQVPPQECQITSKTSNMEQSLPS